MISVTPTPSPLHGMVHEDPSFGWDPWLNPTTDPAKVAQESASLFHGADTIAGDIGLLPLGLSMYASYVDGYGGYDQLVAAREATGAFLLSITIHGGAAHCADVQPGAMAPGQIGKWLDDTAIVDSGLIPGVPWVYTQASSMAEANKHIGGRDVIRWSAHYGFGAHVCGPSTCGWPQADWTQWADEGAEGQNIDRSVGLIVPTPTPPAPARATGIAHFSGHVNFDTGAWAIKGEPGERITWGTDNARWSAEIQVDGSDGSWDVEGLGFNAPIPTTGSPPESGPATGTASFAGTVDFDTGAWTIYGTKDASPVWGVQEWWSAVIKVDNRLGDWQIIGGPFNAPPLGG